ncbi:DUF1631 family protein [Thermomonas haemolytica]|uniref:Uncharacterized protein DUF1631 n=1 Tax=Thermomonas haemolytica TaxID=141949 RepID=A0A4R3N2A7_9GAMM|nr:DUF1631 family protein [Thermomonas haemolytica]TCT23208.1 uncharacterized protein DUF1631 [Thermomonas haemolytica]
MSFRSPADSIPVSSAPNVALLDAVQKHLLDRVGPALDSALADVDDYLFDRSQSGEETLGMLALRDMRRARGEIVQKFRQALLDRFRQLRERQPVGLETASAGLSLLSEQALEEQLAIEQLAASVLRVHASAYEVAAKRLAVVAGRSEIPNRENPLGPAFLAEALGNAMGQLEMDDALRIVVFKYFERELAAALGEVYERCNALMVTAGVLPELRATSRAQAPQPARARPATPEPAAAPAAHAAGMPGMAGSTAEVAPAMQISPADQALFASMLGQLQMWRAAVGMAGQGASAAPAGPVLPTQDLMSILSLMQHDSSAAFMPSASGDQVSLAAQLRQQMAQSARKLGVTGDNLNLDGLDGDAVDLVALLFDVLLDGPQYDNRIRQKIGRMLVPYVKVAVKDRRMFLYKEHPARRLLNTVAEACEGNRGEAPQERELLNHVDHTIDRLVAEFNEDVAIFETLEQELRAYMAQHRKRFELAEKRSAEAQRGRERLEQARASVQADLEWHRGNRALPPVLDDFISKHAAHHLVQMALRDGKGSPRYDSAMRAIDDLLAAFDRAVQRKPLDPARPLPEAELLAMLASAGCIGDAGEAALDALNDALARLVAGEPALQADPRMPAQAVAPEPPTPEPEPRLEVVAGTAGLDYDAAMLARIRKLQVGSWVQLQAGDGHFAPAKVSWISPISSRLLLVNRRGIRVLVASVEELAVMAKLGKVIVREAATAFEDAMHQVADRLQSVAAKP